MRSSSSDGVRDEEDEEECYYEVTCPSCQETICLSEDVLEAGEIDCPNCGECLEFDIHDVVDECACGCGHDHHGDKADGGKDPGCCGHSH